MEIHLNFKNDLKCLDDLKEKNTSLIKGYFPELTDD